MPLIIRTRALGCVAAVAAAIGVSGCASVHRRVEAARTHTRIDDTWVARVPESKMGGIEDAQAHLQKARDEAVRASVAKKDAERQLDVAKQEVTAANARAKAAVSALEVTRARGQQAEITSFEEELELAHLAQSTANALADWRRAEVTEKQAAKTVKEREVEVADAELNQAKFLALRGIGDVRVSELVEEDFAAAIADAKQRVEKARGEAEQHVDTARREQAQFEQLRSKQKGIGGSGPNPRPW